MGCCVGFGVGLEDGVYVFGDCAGLENGCSFFVSFVFYWYGVDFE